MIPEKDLVIPVIGSGAREHALAWKIAQSPLVADVPVIPGNAGTADEPKVRNVALPDQKPGTIADWCAANRASFVIIGPEGPLFEGLADELQDRHIPVFGPGRKGAMIELSKLWAKEFMSRHAIPTPTYVCYTDMATVRAAIHRHRWEMPMVLAADGPAKGKGVKVALNKKEAAAHAERWLPEGPLLHTNFVGDDELSVFAAVRNGRCWPFGAAVDYKRLQSGDQGPNTGGMGSYSPPSFLDRNLKRRIYESIVKPTVQGLAEENIPYTGWIFFGLIRRRSDGAILVLEFNCRLGDPETQTLLMRLQSDVVAFIRAILGDQDPPRLFWNPRPAVATTMAVEGYGEVEQPRLGDPITGLDGLKDVPDFKVFHAGTARRADGTLATAGGRVLSITALGDTVEAANIITDNAASCVVYRGRQWRWDIGVADKTQRR